MQNYDAFLLVSFGGPEGPEDVWPFLRRVTRGRNVPEERLAEVAGHYQAVGGRSPINDSCRHLLGRLEAPLAALGLPCYWGNRNWHPLLEDTLATMRSDGVQRALAFVTSAYGGYSSCRQYLDDITAAQAKVGPGAPAVDKLRLFYNHPGWVGPWATSAARAHRAALSALSRRPPGPDGEEGQGGGESEVEVVFTAHSIPEAAARTSPYVAHVTETARLVAGQAGFERWQLAWQSRSGSPGTPWLGPDICEVVESSPAPAVTVVPVGFVCENLEVTHDLDVEAAAAAARRGMVFQRAEGVSASDSFTEMVVGLVRERLEPTAPRPALGADGPWPESCPAGHCPPPYRIPVG